MTGDSTEESTQRRPRSRRLFATTCVLVVALGAGWVAGLKTHETIDLAQLPSAARAKLAGLGSLVETSRMRLSATLQRRATDEQTTPESSPTTERARFVAREIEGISLKIDQCQVSSEAAVESLRDTLNQIVSSLEGSQRQLEAEFEALRARLDRGDRNDPAATRNDPAATGPVITRLQELNERLDRIERSAAVAALSKAPQPAVANNSVPGTTTTALAPDSAAATAPKSGDKPPNAETNRIPNWIVREVIDGTAILQGPRGVIEVSTGDLIPGVGRVQSIAKKGGRWIVATNKGVISAR
jgi:hypothetical protein